MVELFSDDLIVISSPQKPWVLPHILIEPKTQGPIDALPKKTVQKLFEAANTCASMLFDGLRAQGTNIILNDGPTSTQLHIVARFENDGLNFTWEPKPGDRNEITEIAGKISGAIVVYEPGEAESKKTPAATEPKAQATVIIEPPNKVTQTVAPAKSVEEHKEDADNQPIQKQTVKTVDKKPFDYRYHELHRVP